MPIESFPPEREQNLEQVKLAATRALQKAFEVFSELGERGLEEVQKNQFGETALKVDIACEKAVLDSLKADNIPVRVYSEEHGVIDIGMPQFLATLDGVDGSALYKQDRLFGKYGTMFSLFKGTDPCYADYIMGGIMQHSTKKMLVGLKDDGAWVLEGAEKKPIHTSNNIDFDSKTKIYIDEFFEINRDIFSRPLVGYNTSYKQASSLYYADVAEGLADFALECTRKGNLEIAAAYGLIKEAGGVMVDLDGNDLRGQKYLNFGMKEKEYLPIITASSPELAQKLVAFLRDRRHVAI